MDLIFLCDCWCNEPHRRRRRSTVLSESEQRLRGLCGKIEVFSLMFPLGLTTPHS